MAATFTAIGIVLAGITVLTINVSARADEIIAALEAI